MSPPDVSPPRRNQRGLRPAWVLVLFVTFAAMPLIFAALAYPLKPRPFVDDLASGLGLEGFALLLLEFVFLVRYRWVANRLGNEQTLRLHRIVAYTMMVMLAIHPFIYAAPGGWPWPWFSGSAPALGLGVVSLATALAAWLLIMVLLVTSIDHHALPLRYGNWRGLHTVGGVLVAVLAAIHVFTADGYADGVALAAFLVFLLAAAAVSVILIYGVRPWRQRRSPYVVASVDRVGAKTWSLQLAPRPGRANPTPMRFRPGQYVWLRLGDRLSRAREHPFSISSAPENEHTIGFTIKEKGGFTDGIGDWEVGTPAFLDGPHGHFVPDETEVPTVYIAGGVGISPVLSHLRAFRATHDRRPITLVYGCHTPDYIAERAELDAMAGELDLTVHYVVRYPDADWGGRVGWIDEALLEECLPASGRTRRRYFICGPESMMVTVRKILKRFGVGSERIVIGS